MPILVTGGTGNLGRAFVRAATREGHAVRILSRRHGEPPPGCERVQGDLRSGEGIAAAVADVHTILHAASDPADAGATDVQGTENLAREAERAGVAHLVFVSIVGIDRIPLPYYQRKLATEAVLTRSGVPCSIMRVAQFHSFVDYLLGRAARARLVLPVPLGFWVQSIGTEDVAEELCKVVRSAPSGLLPNLVGPEAMPLTVVGRKWLRARRMRRPLLPVPIGGRVATGFRGRHNTDPGRPSGSLTWEQWLERRYGAGAQ